MTIMHHLLRRALLALALTACDDSEDHLQRADEALLAGDRRAWQGYVSDAVADLEIRCASIEPGPDDPDARIRRSRLERSIRVARAELTRIAAETGESWRANAGDLSAQVCDLARDTSDLERGTE